MDSFTELGIALDERIKDLKRLALMRVEDRGKELFQQDMIDLEASVRALENQVASFKEYVNSELSVMPKVQALIDASKLQSDRLNAIAANLPADLQRPAISSVQGVTYGLERPPGQGPTQPNTNQPGTAATSSGAETSRRNKDVPRWYVSDSELDSVSSYMRGRLTSKKVNAALDELAAQGLANQKLMAAAKSGGKLAPAERKRATDLLHSVAIAEGVKGNFWFLETDLRDCSAIKPDKSGKAMLTLLRHLRRLQEVRCNVDGKAVTVYVLMDRS